MLEAHSGVGRDILGGVEPNRVASVPSDVTPASRKLCLAILLGLLIGHISVALHTAAHATKDAGECSICISYGHLAKAVTDHPVLDLPRNRPLYVAAPEWPGDGLPALITVRQRGPPASI